MSLPTHMHTNHYSSREWCSRFYICPLLHTCLKVRCLTFTANGSGNMIVAVSCAALNLSLWNTTRHHMTIVIWLPPARIYTQRDTHTHTHTHTHSLCLSPKFPLPLPRFLHLTSCSHSLSVMSHVRFVSDMFPVNFVPKPVLSSFPFLATFSPPVSPLCASYSLFIIFSISPSFSPYSFTAVSSASSLTASLTPPALSAPPTGSCWAGRSRPCRAIIGGIVWGEGGASLLSSVTGIYIQKDF